VEEMEGQNCDPACCILSRPGYAIDYLVAPTLYSTLLQCFDAVGWAAGRESGL